MSPRVAYVGIRGPQPGYGHGGPRVVALAKQPEFAGKTIVAILPDSGERYISTILFEGIG